MAYNKFFDKRSFGGGVSCEIMPKQLLAEELPQKIITNTNTHVKNIHK